MCLYSEPSCFKSNPSATHLVIILVYWLSHVVYAHSLHTQLLCYLQSRFSPRICLPLPLSQQLGHPNSTRASTTHACQGPHNPLQCLSQATSVEDVTLKLACSMLTTLRGCRRCGWHCSARRRRSRGRGKRGGKSRGRDNSSSSSRSRSRAKFRARTTTQSRGRSDRHSNLSMKQ